MNAQPAAPRITLSGTTVVWRGQVQGAETISLNIANPDSADTEYAITVEGIERGWYTVASSLRVAARRTASTEVRIQPPPRAPQGEYPFRVVVSVSGRPDLRAEAPARLSLPVDDPRQPAQHTSYSPLGLGAGAPAGPTPGSSVPTLPPEVRLGPRTTFRAGAGEAPVQAIITIQNRSRLLERYVISVSGLPEEWSMLAMSELRLEPGASGQVPLRLSPQAGSSTPAGDYPFRIRVAPSGFPDSYAEVGGSVALVGTASFDARLTPQQTDGRKEKFKLTLRNTGGLPLSLLLEASDMEGMCSFQHAAPPPLEPGQEAVVPIWVGAHRNGLVGMPKRLDFRVRVAPAGSTASAARSFDARFVHTPFLSPNLGSKGLLLALLVMVIGLAISVGRPGLTSAFNTVRCKAADQEVDSLSGAKVVLETCGGLPYAEQRGLRVATSPVPTATRGAGSVTATSVPATVAPQPTATPRPQQIVRKISPNRTLTKGALAITLKTVEVVENGRLRFELNVKNSGLDNNWLEDKLGLGRPEGPFVQDSTGRKVVPDEWGVSGGGQRELGQQLPLPRNGEVNVYVIYPAIDATKPFALQDEVLFDNLTIPGPTSLSSDGDAPAQAAAQSPAAPEPPAPPPPPPTPVIRNCDEIRADPAYRSSEERTFYLGTCLTQAAGAALQAAAGSAASTNQRSGSVSASTTGGAAVSSAPPSAQEPPAAPAAPPPEPVLTGVLGDAVRLINDYRAQNGLSRLRVNGNLNAAAGNYANVIAATNHVSHVGQDGSTETTRGAAAGYGGFVSGEVLTASPAQNVALNAINAWRASPPHNAILLNPAAVDIGVGRGFNANSPYQYYWIVMTGIP